MYDEYTGVSIHALLAECDIFWIQLVNVPRGFNPRTPCGVRLETLAPMTPTPQFQSTHSLRSATYGPLDMETFLRVSIHALLAECDRFRHPIPRVVCGFNPRTPCGVRPFPPENIVRGTGFQSTHSLRSATYGPLDMETFLRVSIHALLAECDRFRHPIPRVVCGFNPRTPCGVRPFPPENIVRGTGFQSTHSLRSATQQGGNRKQFRRVSIHALLAECDWLLLEL